MQNNSHSTKNVSLDGVCVYNHFPCYIRICECSETSMIISTRSNARMGEFRSQDSIQVIIPMDNEDLSMTAYIRKVGKTDSSHCILDVQFPCPDKRYLQYLSELD